jgi:tRNA-specific adenosine deaminase 3
MTSDGSDVNPLSGGLKHGLFWRPSELNWKFLAWEFIEDDRDMQAGALAERMIHV